MQKSFQVGSKTFILDQAKAEAAFAAKTSHQWPRDHDLSTFLPLKYQWAYELYKTMKANHWEPEDVPMGKDIEQWRDATEVATWSVGSSAWASATSQPPRELSETIFSTWFASW